MLWVNSIYFHLSDLFYIGEGGEGGGGQAKGMSGGGEQEGVEQEWATYIIP